MAGVNFRINTKHIGEVRMFDEPSVKNLLSKIVHLIGVDSSLDSKVVVSLFAHNFV